MGKKSRASAPDDEVQRDWEEREVPEVFEEVANSEFVERTRVWWVEPNILLIGRDDEDAPTDMGRPLTVKQARALLNNISNSTFWTWAKDDESFAALIHEFGPKTNKKRRKILFENEVLAWRDANL